MQEIDKTMLNEIETSPKPKTLPETGPLAENFNRFPQQETISSMTVAEIKDTLHVHTSIENGIEKMYVPFSSELFLMAFNGLKSKEEILSIYNRLQNPHWENFKTVDQGVTNKEGEIIPYMPMHIHAQRAAAMMLEFSSLYWHTKSHKESKKEKLKDTAFLNINSIVLSSSEVQKVAQDTLLALLHDIGKGWKDENGYKHRPYLISVEQHLPPELRNIMEDHPEDGVAILQEVGLGDSFLIDPVRDHHRTVYDTKEKRIVPPAETSKETKILAIIDGIDTATSDRPYFPANHPGELPTDRILLRQLTHYNNKLLTNVTMKYISLLIQRDQTPLFEEELF